MHTAGEPQLELRSASVEPLRAYLDPVDAIRNLWRHRDVAWQLAQRDIAARYRATYLGLAWAVLYPLLLLSIYTLIFAVVLKARWGDNADETRGEFALAMWCGLLIYNVFSEVMVRAPGMVSSYPAYVKKLVFPLEVFVVSGLLAALLNFLFGFAVWLVAWLMIMHTLPPASILWLPVLLVPVCLLTSGLSWICASLGVFVRDLGYVVSLLVQMMFFLTPIFYRLDRMPYPWRYILYANPITWAIEDARNVMMWGHAPNWIGLTAGTLVAGLIALCGYAFFMKSKRAFADVV